MRLTKDEYYLNIANAVAGRGTCLRRNYGAVIVKEDCIVSTGYTGSAKGTANCCNKNVCKRNELGIIAGERYDLCVSVHGEMNAIIHADYFKMRDSVLYLEGIVKGTGKICDNTPPCYLCRRFIINAGIKKVITRNEEGFIKEWIVDDWVKEGA